MRVTGEGCISGCEASHGWGEGAADSPGPPSYLESHRQSGLFPPLPHSQPHPYMVLHETPCTPRLLHQQLRVEPGDLRHCLTLPKATQGAVSDPEASGGGSETTVAAKISSMSLKAVSPCALTQSLPRGPGSPGRGVRSSVALSLSRLVRTIEVANIWRSYWVPRLVLCALRNFSSGQPCAMVTDVTTTL